jgi:hypothetical protein
MSARITCRFCWKQHEAEPGSFRGHVICPEAGEESHLGQQPLRCYSCAAPPLAGHRGAGGRPACKVHQVERPDLEKRSFEQASTQDFT